MKKSFFCAAFAAFALVACENKSLETHEDSDEMVNLEILIPDEQTKVAGVGGNEEKTIADYQVLI